MALENLSEKLSELAQTGVAKTKELLDAGMAKTKELTEIGRLKVDNASEQEAIKKAYLEIGKLYFAERGMDPEAPYSALCEKIAASKAKIDYNQERIADLKAAGAPADVEDAGVEDVEVEEDAPAGDACDGCPCCQEPAPAEDQPAEDQPEEPKE